MPRLTKVLNDNKFYIVGHDKVNHDDNGYFGEAVNKLAKFENIYEHLVSEQSKISEELEKLRLENKTRSVKFKQLLASKLTNNNILILFKTYGLQ